MKHDKKRPTAATADQIRPLGRKEQLMITEKSKVSQVKLIAAHLIMYGSISSIEAIELFGCTRLSARISDLKKRGWPITTEMATGKNRYGNNSNFAVYKMEAPI